ncbi:MAG: bifunctional riboflavin kinase/FAD synthetase, partial [Propionibacteriaceae bacterium]
VHRGHQELLQRAVATGQRVVAVTFRPHPMHIIRPDLAPKLLGSFDQRCALLKEHGADEVVVVDFTEDVAHWTPAQFVENVLAPLSPSTIVVGDNFRFGHRATGDVQTLRELAQCEVIGVPLVRLGNTEVSSTAVREALVRGDVATAGELLGRPYRFCGTVVTGDRRGRELGFPTANLRAGATMAVPADGVYAGWLTVLDEPGAEPMISAISVGTNPTFAGEERRVETYVIDRHDLQLYDRPIAVDFAHLLRGQVKFDGLASLIQQMTADVRQAKHLLGG